MAAAPQVLPRPADHPAELPWPPVRPSYPPDSPALVHKPSASPFNYDAALASFGKNYIEALRVSQSQYRGDWWFLALLYRCSDVIKASKEDAVRIGASQLWGQMRANGLHHQWRPHLDLADLSGLHLYQMDFTSAYLGGTNFTLAHLDRSVFSSASLEGANFCEARVSSAYFQSASLTNARFDAADLSGSRLENANARGASFVAALLHGASIAQADFAKANLLHARLVECNASLTVFTQCNLRHLVLERASVAGADFRRSDLSKSDWRYADVSSAKIAGSKLIRVKGLFGHSRAMERSDKINEHEAQDAIYYGKWDFLSWERLRVIGGLRLFGVSYLTIAAITLYAAIARQYNTAAESARATALDAQNAGDATVSFWSRVLSELPRIPLPAHLGNQLMATIAVAAAATLYAFACPAEVKEANEVRWTRAMGQPLWEYRSANWSDPWARYISGTLFAAGGGYSIYYLMHRSWNALSYLLFGS